MRKTLFYLIAIFAFLSCGDLNSKIESYENAMKKGDVEKAASILQDINAEELTAQQMDQIDEIHNKYASAALDKILDEFEELIKKDKVEEASALLEGIQTSDLTAEQGARVSRIMREYSESKISDFTNAAGSLLNGIFK